jgi:hypothetical protein
MRASLRLFPDSRRSFRNGQRHVYVPFEHGQVVPEGAIGLGVAAGFEPVFVAVESRRTLLDRLREKGGQTLPGILRVKLADWGRAACGVALAGSGEWSTSILAIRLPDVYTRKSIPA